ncbi:hydantoinase B/oxoprolinase family protein [Bordetella sp. BOR01]|uniref:hydantoinase B/oxoprolinase family protein n=1 Tax=Bordetella sp. BOR01 TaxID=2854779 RepID=UPI001C48EEAE|nr:hydantoinase B/oxoprolinase family protein [Bordetella sp. BOR01]MBV7486509.1 hydantoinase B/oxoprolinase family protein [Bordetella sp. BOR01]
MSASIKVREQIMWNRLISVVEEQAATLVRTAFCTSVREAGDLSAGVFDAQGRMIAQAVTGTPGHVNSMAESVGHFVARFGDGGLAPGDVLVTNDPWMGTGHLHDITMVTPVYRRPDGPGEPRLIGFFASTAHVVDIGGRGFGPDAGDVYEEGLRIPLMKFYKAGVLNEDLVELLRTNVRERDQVIGDFHSLVACNETGRRRLDAMLDEFGLPDLEELAAFIFGHSERATREYIAALPSGKHGYEMRVDGYESPIDLRVAVHADGGTMYADFAGTSGPSKYGINVPLTYTKAYACYALKCAIAPEIPNNWASLRPFEISAPEGCILNAPFPAPVAVRHVLGHLLPDVVLGALQEYLPDLIPAEGASALWNLQMRFQGVRQDNRQARHEMLIFNTGGTGARPASDGLSTTAFPSGVHTMSAEVTESIGPIVVWRKELRPDSGGAGKWRGGLGQRIEIGAHEGYQFTLNAMFDRVAYPARGHAGGHDGAAGGVGLDDGSVLRAKGSQLIPEGQRLVLDLPGGGGFGQPAQRPAELVRRDVRYGYISEAQARRDYPHAFE